ncbi:MAG: hypothetical protein ABJ013_10290 [Halioglobus sp.]
MSSDPNIKAPNTTSPLSFWQELKRRKVIRVATVYAVVGWVIIQVAATTFPSFGIPDWAFRFVTLLVLLGLPVALILAWALELTPEGIMVTQPTEGSENLTGESTPASKKQSWHTYAFAGILLTLTIGALAMFLSMPVDESDAALDMSEASTNAEVDTTSSESIAVMPLVNMSSLEENAYFAGGIHEDVLTNLSRIEDLQVISRTSMLRYATSDKSLREIGTELGVDYIVEGSVRRIGNHVRVTIQLINAHNDVHIWANNFEREVVDVFATQSELAKEISDSLHLEIQPESVGTLEGMPTFSVKAYDLFIKSESLEKTEGETEENVVQRRKMLEEAVTEDPNFVEAWAVLKRLYDLQLSRLGERNWYVGEGEDREAVAADIRARSQRALEKAIALDPDNVETLLAIAVDHERDRKDERRQEQKAVLDQIIAVAPENAKAWYHLGYWYSHLQDLPNPDEEAITRDAAAAFEEALRLDPFNARIVKAVLVWYRNRGFEEDVARLSKRINQIVPETSADRRLARVSWQFLSNQIEAAFLETADESFIEEFRQGLQEAIDSGDYAESSSILRYWDEAKLSIWEGDMDKTLELSRIIPFELNESRYDTVFFALLKGASMTILTGRGDIDEARHVAQTILKQEELFRARDKNECVCYLGVLAHANAVLGDEAKALRLTEELLEVTGWTPVQRLRILGEIDVEQAVEAAFANLAEISSGNGFDVIASEYLFYKELVVHPRVQAYYVNEGKWIDYLAERVPEYAKYKHESAN